MNNLSKLALLITMFVGFTTLLNNFINLKKEKEQALYILTAPIPTWLFILTIGILAISFPYMYPQNEKEDSYNSGSPEKGETTKEDQINFQAMSFEDNKQKWDLKDFKKETDNFYCPRETANYDYYYIWYKEKVALVGNNYFKIYSRPADSKYSDESGEIVIKEGKKEKIKEEATDKEYSELYIPTRNKETVQYKMIVNGNLEFYQPGGQITTPVKDNSPLEILAKISIAESNRVSSDYLLKYISNTTSSTRLQDPLSYPVFSIEETNPEELVTSIGIGVDKKSCIKIEEYYIGISNEDFEKLKDR